MSTLEKRVTVATTMAPGGDLQNQRKAINSWLRAGFEVISVNAPEEIELLKATVPEATFYPAETDGRDRFGKPYIFLHTILQALAKSEAEICGIVNSDIHLVHKGILELIKCEAQESFLFGSRVDVNSLEDIDGGLMYRGGFDYFFFNRDVLSIYPDEEFCLGLPWWDYWIVLVPIVKGIPVKRVESPTVCHLAHPIRFPVKEWYDLGFTMNKYFTPAFDLTQEAMPNYLGMMLNMIYTHSTEIVVTKESQRNC